MAVEDVFLVIMVLFISSIVINDLMIEHRRRINIIERENFRIEKCTSVVLFPDQVYLFKSNAIGNFRVRGGFTGNMTVDGRQVTIWDEKGALYFQCGTTKDRVEFKDEDGITTVNTIVNGARKLIRLPDDKIFNLQLKHKEIQVGLQLSNDDYENPGPLQIVGYPDEEIIIASHRPAVVTGNGGYLKKMGSNTVTVRGNLKGVGQEGTSTINVHGNVTGDVRDVGLGSINIEGDVLGKVTSCCSEGMGSIIIKGNVHGDIHCEGFGSVEVLGRHLNGGKVFTEGFGHVSVNGAGTTSFVGKLLRFL